MPDKNTRLVYSTDGTNVTAAKPARTPAAKQPSRQSAPKAPAVPDDGIVRIQRSSKGHGGKTVTIVTGLPGSEADLDALLKTLKQLCGSGGTRDGRTLEIQGDHRDRLLTKLETLGHRAKLAGG